MGTKALLIAATTLVLGFAFLASSAAQRAANTESRTAVGKPDLNGIWQALNEANYDIEAHVARPAMAVRPGPYVPVPAAPMLELGAVGSVPPGLGVVESLSTREKKTEPGRFG
jgi:hypothetical protein